MSGDSFPVVVLVEPQLHENIGFVARTMKNFGFCDLRMVSPSRAWPGNRKAYETAAGADDLLDNVAIFERLEEALADVQFVVATSARNRYITKETVDMPQSQALFARMRGLKAAVVFGPERTGLRNAHVSLADVLLSIPTEKSFPSLNLAQAVAVVCYGFSTFANENEVESAMPHEENLPSKRGLATKEELFGLFSHLESALDEGEFFRVPQKREHMVHNLRAIFARSSLSVQEVDTLRGVIRALNGTANTRGTAPQYGAAKKS